MKYLSTLIFLFISLSLFSQKFIQIEKLNSPKTNKFQIGNEVTFQLEGGQWYTRVIEDVNYEKQYLLFSNGHVKLEDITAFKTFNNRKWSRSLGNQMIAFAPVWAGYTAIASAVDDEISFGKGDFIIMGVAAGVGILTRLIFKSRTYKFQKNNKPSNRWRLRIIDLEVSKRDFQR
jgi:hypothetical protein